MKKAVIFQIFLLFALLMSAFVPLKFGEPLQIEAKIYDPRDLFRGNYVNLDFVFSNVDKKGEFKDLHGGDKIYAIFENNASSDTLKFTKLSLKAPKNGIYLGGKVSECWNLYHNGEMLKNMRCKINYGIEAYFLPKDVATKAELKMREIKAKLNLRVLWGNARIESLQIGGEIY